MPLLLWLASFIGAIFSSVVSFFMQYMTRRIAITVAIVAAIGALTTAFFSAIYLLGSQLAGAAPDFVSQSFSLVVPSNFPAVASIWLAARALRWVYEWNVKVIQMRLS